MAATHDPAILLAVATLQNLCHNAAKNTGWWPELTPENPTPPLGRIGWALTLIHSEVSESAEGFRKDIMDDKLPHRKASEVELADTLIRIFDLAGACNMDLAGAFVEKLEFNRTRADHKPENRALAGGKKV